jgi:autotransporter-associated beta strand protein
MRKLIYLLLLAVFCTAGNGSMLHAENYFKKYHINENFDGAETLPSGWTGATSGLLYGNAGGVSLTSVPGAITTSGSGSGSRGVEIRLPSTLNNSTVGESDVWYIELDWTITNATLGPKNSCALIFNGSNSLKQASWYIDAIFGLYLFGDGYVHLWNLDPWGPDATTLPDPDPYEGKIGPLYEYGQYSSFWRAGTDATVVAERNASTKTDVTYTAGNTYHILAKLNFATQKIEELTIAQKVEAGAESNTQTFTDIDFLAPWTIGSDASVKPVDERIVSDVSIISSFNTRSSKEGNGSDANLNVQLDNIAIYYLEESIGTADVSVNYKDEAGNPLKTRTVEAQEIGELFRLQASDMVSFFNDESYYAYDAEATHTANADKAEDGESLIVAASDNSLDVIFKAFPKTDGTYVWKGQNNNYWDELNANFAVDGVTAELGYQAGQEVVFSDASAPKDVAVNGTVDLGENSMGILTAGYNFSNDTEGSKIIGTGDLRINASVTLGADNRLTGGAIVNTTDEVYVKHASAASKFQVIDNATLNIEIGNGGFSQAITGTGVGSTLNIIASSFEQAYWPAIDSVAVINITKTQTGRLNNSTWADAWTGTFGAFTDALDNPVYPQINIINGVEGNRLAGFGASSVFADAKLHLGDSIRLVRNYNESSGTGQTVGFGELSGTAGSFIETGFVDGRIQFYNVGALDTDATFAGTIRPYQKNDSTTSTSVLNLNKVGLGTWTLTGSIAHKGTIGVNGGTLEIFGEVADSVTTISVEEDATLRTGEVTIGSAIVNVNAGGTLEARSTTFAGDIQVSDATLSGAASAYNIGLVNASVNLAVTRFEEGGYNKLTAESDITIVGGRLNITVNGATAGETILLLEAGSGQVAYPELYPSVFVNEVDITDNTEETEGAEFVWFPETGELKSLIDKEEVAIDDVSASKAVKSVLYFDLLGRPVPENTQGIIIRKTIYEDSSVKTDKVFKAYQK